MDEPFDPSKLSMQFFGTGYTYAIFKFIAIDNAGAEAPEATYTLSWPNPVPVNFLKFDAAVKGNSVELNWTAAQEHEMVVYEVERSVDGKSWERIAELPAAHNKSETNTYNHTDYHPLKGKSMYRIKQQDADGSVNYSQVRTVLVDGSMVHLYHNPAQKFVVVEGLPFKGEIEIVAINGVTLSQHPVTHSRMNINIGSLTLGTYFLNVKEEGHIKASVKFIKQ